MAWLYRSASLRSTFIVSIYHPHLVSHHCHHCYSFIFYPYAASPSFLCYFIILMLLIAFSSPFSSGPKSVTEEWAARQERIHHWLWRNEPLQVTSSALLSLIAFSYCLSFISPLFTSTFYCQSSLLYSINHCGFGYTPFTLRTSNSHTHPLTTFRPKFTLEPRTHARHYSYPQTHSPCPHFNYFNSLTLAL